MAGHRRHRQPRVIVGRSAVVGVLPPGHRHGEHVSVVSPWKKVLSSICAFLLCLLTGWLGAMNLHFNGRTEGPRDVNGLISQREQRVKSLHNDISQLSSEIDSINKTVGTIGKTQNDTHQSASSGSVLPALKGPGVSVTLNDSPLWKDALRTSDKELTDRDVNDYVVHQQDLEAVINALWAGGAEAMTIQGERVLPTTAVRCVGNVLLLRGRQYAPPYTVAAIGPVRDMRMALDASPAVRIYRQYVDAVGLGWSVHVSNTLRFAASTSAITSLTYATAIPTKKPAARKKPTDSDNSRTSGGAQGRTPARKAGL